jgi:hypothetical protein
MRRALPGNVCPGTQTGPSLMNFNQTVLGDFGRSCRLCTEKTRPFRQKSLISFPYRVKQRLKNAFLCVSVILTSSLSLCVFPQMPDRHHRAEDGDRNYLPIGSREYRIQETRDEKANVRQKEFPMTVLFHVLVCHLSFLPSSLSILTTVNCSHSSFIILSPGRKFAPVAFRSPSEAFAPYLARHFCGCHRQTNVIL